MRIRIWDPDLFYTADDFGSYSAHRNRFLRRTQSETLVTTDNGLDLFSYLLMLQFFYFQLQQPVQWDRATNRPPLPLPELFPLRCKS
jgi:hypothetical protein